MTRGQHVADAARTCVGARFRLHGRDPATGLDCVGVAAVALRAAGWVGDVPSGYALRSGDAAGAISALDRVLVRTGEEVGALILVRAGPGQLHLAIRIQGGIVHADAALRRVVERPGPVPWPVLGAWQIGEE